MCGRCYCIKKNNSTQGGLSRRMCGFEQWPFQRRRRRGEEGGALPTASGQGGESTATSTHTTQTGFIGLPSLYSITTNKWYSFGNKGASPNPPSVQLRDQISLMVQTFFLICIESLTRIIYTFWWFHGPKIISNGSKDCEISKVYGDTTIFECHHYRHIYLTTITHFWGA